MSPRKKEYTERINVFFTPEQLKQVKAEADKSGLTVSAYVRMMAIIRNHDQQYIMKKKEMLKELSID